MRTVDAGGLKIGDGHPPRIMGVLNVSEESPYDPSVFDDPAEAAQYVDEQLLDQGADIVDIGLESANKRYDVLSPAEELERLETAIETIELVGSETVFSIETRYSEVAAEALSRGFDMVNDVCGFADPKMASVCREFDAAVVKMASPPDLERPGAVEETPWAERKGESWANSADYVDMVYEALAQNGFTEKTIIDPAFGGWSEAKTIADDRETFRRLREFRGHARPILVSINRKNFLRKLADRSTEAALAVSLAATSMAVERGAHIIRTHDVAETRDAALVGSEFMREQTVFENDVRIEELDVTTTVEARRHMERIESDPDLDSFAVTLVYEIDGLTDAEIHELERVAKDGEAMVGRGQTGVLLLGDVNHIQQLHDGLSGASGRLATVRDHLGVHTR